jgi:hypothetical protein
MDKSSVHKSLSQIGKRLREISPKFLRVTSLDGRVILPFNPIGKNPLTRLTDAEKKLPSLPDGVYIFQAQDSLSPGAFSHRLLFGKGKYDETQELTISEPPAKSQALPMLSVENALKNVQDSAKATAENEYLKKENEELKRKNEELSEKLKALEYLQTEEEEDGMEEEPEGPELTKWLNNTLPTLLPLADRYFDLEEKKLELQKSRLISSPPKKRAGLPPINSPEYHTLVEEISSLEDAQFFEVMNKIKAQSPAHYNAILPLVWEEEEQTEEEQNTEE